MIAIPASSLKADENTYFVPLAIDKRLEICAFVQFGAIFPRHSTFHLILD